MREGLLAATLLALLACAAPSHARNGWEGRGEGRGEVRERWVGGAEPRGGEWRGEVRRDTRRDDRQPVAERRQPRQLSPEERRQLRRDVLEANRDYAPSGRR